jgi:hypothetical protein
VEAGTSVGDDVEGSSGSSSSPLKLYSFSSTKMSYSISLSPEHSKTSRGQGVLIKHSVRSAMRCITKQNAIRGMRLKFVHIAMLQDKTLATKRLEMRDE